MERVCWLRYVVPPVLALVVVIYQLGIAQWLELNYGPGFHYGFEIGFYSLVGPVATLFTLTWAERRLQEKERLEREIQAHSQQLASLTAVSADAIVSLNRRGEIVSWNQGAEQMLGYEASAMLGWSLSEPLPEVNSLINRASEKGQVQTFETKALSSDGRTLMVELTQTRLTKVDDVSPASLIIMRDVTARLEREAVRDEERERIARDLHDGVAQTLYFMALKADMARQQYVRQPQQIAAELKEIGQTARHVIREVRRTIFALRPLNWAAGGFLPALRDFALGFAEQAGWQAAIEIDEDSVSIPPGVIALRSARPAGAVKSGSQSARTVFLGLDLVDHQNRVAFEVRMLRYLPLTLLLTMVALLAACQYANDVPAPTPAEGILSGVPSLSELAGTPAPEAQPLPTPDADEIVLGQELYAIHCASCHGVELEGEVDWQLQNEDGTFRAPPHDAGGHTWHHSDKLLLESIRLGGTRLPDNIGGVSEMPAFEGVLDERQMLTILTYIKSTWPEDIRQIQWEQTVREP